jgi:TonB-linked SusC/RagA family outer membrane protein
MKKTRYVCLFLFFYLMAADLSAQKFLVNGTVRNEKGVPVGEVTVRELNGAKGISTDSMGKFRITLQAINTTLVFSHVGYNQKMVKINGNTAIDVVLESKNESLDEVVVIGYGTVKKSDLTGSVSHVNMEDLTKAPVATFAQALAGRTAGVQVSSGDGQPGAEMNIVIRGGGSLTQSVAPLYVVDGFPIEGFDPNYLSPLDIESINILKDASATAIYGARGANGVVVIETKKGKIGVPKINYAGSFGLNQVTRRMNMMSPYEFARFQLEKWPAEASASLFPGFPYVSGGPLPDPEIYRNASGIDWQDRMFRNGFTANSNLSMSGGTATTKYLFSGTAFNQQGTVINTGYSRYQGRLSLDQTISNKLRTAINVTYASIKSNGALASQNTISGNGTNALFYNVWGYRPIAPEGSNFDDFLIDPDIDSRTDLRVNPVIDTKNQQQNRYVTGFLGNINLSWTIAKDLVLKIQGGLDSKKEKNDYFFNSQTGRGTPLRPGNLQGVQAGVTFRQTNVWSNDNTLSYKKRINKDNLLDLMAGFSIQGINYENYALNVTQIPNEELGLSDLDEGTPYTNSALLSSSRLLSGFARVNYNLKSKYLFTVTARSDGSSKFARGKRWGYFPSGAFAWKMGDENFMKDLRFVSDAKLRISYGLTGNNRVGDFDYLAAINLPVSASYSFDNQIPSKGAVLSNFGNADLKWETTAQLDLGYDISFLDQRIDLTADIYRKTTTNLLLKSNTPYVTGFETAFKNIGKLQNDGLELTLNTINIRSKTFTWQSTFNISFNKNKLISLNEGEDFILSPVDWHSVFNNQALYTAKIGEPAAQFIGVIWDGVYQLDDFNIIQTPTGTTYQLKNSVPSNGVIRSVIQPGDIKYRDLNGDGIVNDQDRTVIGRALPIYIGGFGNNFNYKNFSLNVFMQWSYGNDIYNANRMLFEGDQGQRPLLNQFASYEDRWSLDNTGSKLFRAGPGSPSGPSGVYSSRTIEDGSFLRIKTLSLGYALPPKIIKKMGVQSISLAATAENLYTWTKYSGMDPEVSVRNAVLTPGFDFSPYPRARTIVFNINVSF